MSWCLRGIRHSIPLLLPEKDRGSRPGEIRNITLLLIELLEMWLRSMTLYFYGCLSFLGKFTHQSQEYLANCGLTWRHRAFVTYFTTCNRNTRFYCLYRQEDPKRKAQSYTCPSISFQMRQLYKSLPSPEETEEGRQQENFCIWAATAQNKTSALGNKCFLLTSRKEKSHKNVIVIASH